MGFAVYGLPGLVSSQPLAEFWQAPTPPDKKLFEAFRGYVIDHAQIYGGFYRPMAIRLAVQESVARLLGEAYV